MGVYGAASPDDLYLFGSDTEVVDGRVPEAHYRNAGDSPPEHAPRFRAIRPGATDQNLNAPTLKSYGSPTGPKFGGNFRNNG